MGRPKGVVRHVQTDVVRPVIGLDVNGLVVNPKFKLNPKKFQIHDISHDISFSNVAFYPGLIHSNL